ncbi:hypothetical protein [Actinacidiphila acidipaludis]|uniref:ABC transporter permease n=1 Tax=Actinacidiphila acidipaludis TaxID=2873382 RepID=A0ABS7QDX4_9ACTN|nr:hypothetical protein [Streptomyces acidipaludis]MBY8881178.1 hypothetical protein [Streptomyces acidipaludis]
MGSVIGALGATFVSLVFIASFMGALHAPGPRAVPIAVVGTQAQASAIGDSLGKVRSGGYDVSSYPTAQAARDAILDRKVDAALLPAPPGAVLAVATAAGSAVTNATVADVSTVAQASGTQLALQNIRPLPANDPQGISQVFFVIALLAPSLVFANMLVTRFGRAMHPVGQLLSILAYSVIVAAVAVAVTDPGIGALTGAPWGLFGIGTLLAFAAAVTAAAAARWARGLGYLVVFLLFIPVGVASSGTTLGPHMITQWYADVGKALPAGAALPAVQNTVYFSGNDTATPLLILSAWAVAGAMALALTAYFRPPALGAGRHEPAHPTADPGATAPQAQA